VLHLASYLPGSFSGEGLYIPVASWLASSAPNTKGWKASCTRCTLLDPSICAARDVYTWLPKCYVRFLVRSCRLLDVLDWTRALRVREPVEVSI
jgi:hypothetical protein